MNKHNCSRCPCCQKSIECKVNFDSIIGNKANNFPAIKELESFKHYEILIKKCTCIGKRSYWSIVKIFKINFLD